MSDIVIFGVKKGMTKETKNKVLFIASIYTHFSAFHIPFIKLLQKKGYEVHTAALKDEAFEQIRDLNVYCWDIPFARFPLNMRNIKAYEKLKQLLQENKYDLVHVHTPVAAFLGRYLSSKTKQKAVLYTAHGFHFYKGAPFLNWLLFYPIEKIAAKWTDGLVTINKEDYQSACENLNIKKENIFYVPGVGVDVVKYQTNEPQKRAKLRRELGLNEKDILLITVAELNQNKNHMQIINSLPEVIANNENVHYLIVGDGNNKKVIQEKIKKLKIQRHVHLIGYRKDIPDLLHACDIFLLTSKREGLPRCIMEAMAAGKPIIAANIRGCRDMVVDGDNGYLVPLNDSEATSVAIMRIANDSRVREDMGQKSRELVSRYSLSFILREMDDVYNKFLIK